MAETGFLIRRNPDTVIAPDFAFIPTDRIPAEGLPAGFCASVPALVVEVVSPGDRAGEIEAKIQRWLAFGVDQVWVIYPESRRVYVYEPGGKYMVYQGEDTITGGTVLPGLEIKVPEIFEN